MSDMVDKADAWDAVIARGKKDAATIEQLRAERDKAEAALAEAIAGLKRLRSPEAFVMSKVTNEEERARMFYADEVLASLTEEEVKP